MKDLNFKEIQSVNGAKGECSITVNSDGSASFTCKWVF